MQIKLNGKTRETGAGTLTELVEAFKLSPETIVIEHNGVLTKKTAWAGTALNAGDEVEIVAFVGGG
jgi:thiamine biosynthesis protein ThiS